MIQLIKPATGGFGILCHQTTAIVKSPNKVIHRPFIIVNPTTAQCKIHGVDFIFTCKPRADGNLVYNDGLQYAYMRDVNIKLHTNGNFYTMPVDDYDVFLQQLHDFIDDEANFGDAEFGRFTLLEERVTTALASAETDDYVGSEALYKEFSVELA
jgi:hypothetical protein